MQPRISLSDHDFEATMLHSLHRFEQVIVLSRELAGISGFEALAQQAEINAETRIAETMAYLDALRAEAAKV